MKFVRPSPTIMSGAKISGIDFLTAEALFKSAPWLVKAIHDVLDLFGRVRRGDLAISPIVLMVIAHVLAMVNNNLKVLDSVVRLVAVDVVNDLRPFQTPTKMLLHNVTVLQNSLAIDVDTDVAVVCETGLTLFQVPPVWGNVVVAMSSHSAAMSPAHLPVPRFQDVGTTFNSTNFSGSHATHHTVKGKVCQ